MTLRTPPALFGEHNDYVYRELLGLGDEECARLESAGHIATTYGPEVLGVGGGGPMRLGLQKCPLGPIMEGACVPPQWRAPGSQRKMRGDGSMGQKGGAPVRERLQQAWPRFVTLVVWIANSVILPIILHLFLERM